MKTPSAVIRQKGKIWGPCTHKRPLQQGAKEQWRLPLHWLSLVFWYKDKRCGPCTHQRPLHLFLWPLHISKWPLHTFIGIYRICGPCTWPLHLFSWPLHRPLPQENAPFRPSKRYTKFVVVKHSEIIYFFYLPYYVADEITNFLKNSHFENMKAGFLLRCQNSFR
jgi:hypothetical protein